MVKAILPVACSCHFSTLSVYQFHSIEVQHQFIGPADSLMGFSVFLDCLEIKGLLLRFYGRKEGNVLFNDALNTFYLRLYGVRHMVKDHSDSEKGNPLPPHRLLLSINSLYGRKEGNVLFNDALNTFYLRLYGGKGPLSERGNPLPPHGLLFPISSKGYFICTIPQTG